VLLTVSCTYVLFTSQAPAAAGALAWPMSVEADADGAATKRAAPMIPAVTTRLI
jgi:hypothetical protein